MSTHIKLVTFLSLGLVVVFCWHFATVLGLFGSPPANRFEFFVRFAIIIGGFLATSAFVTGLIAKKDENAVLPDEREEKIELRAERAGNGILYLGLIGIMWFAFTPLTPMQVANSILALVCVIETIKVGLGLYFLQRGH